MERKLIRNLIDRADDLIATIDGTTDQFADEVSRLSDATSALDKACPAPDSVAGHWQIRCPECGHNEQIDISAKVWVRLCPDGTDVTAAANGDHEWADDSDAVCVTYGHHANVAAFSKAGGKP